MKRLREKFLNSVADIRDRALFYRHLLLTVSGDKVSTADKVQLLFYCLHVLLAYQHIINVIL